MNKLIFSLILIIVINSVRSYNILLVFPHPGKSHAILGAGYARHLLNAGHEITYITPVLLEPHPRLKQIDVSSHTAAYENVVSFGNFQGLKRDGDLGKDEDYLYNLLFDVQTRFITDKNIQNFLMKSTEKFDLAIIQWLYSELNSGFAAVFNIPYIWSSSFETHPAILSLIDEAQNPASFRNHIAAVSPPLTFIERAQELWRFIRLFRIRWSLKDKSEIAFRNAFGPAASKRGITLPTLDEFKYKSSLVFGNSHVTAGEAHKLPQNYIPIAGFHIEENLKPLPEKLQKIMDEAEDGVIYFSMGSVIKSKTMPNKTKSSLKKIFGELKQTVIWKFEEDLPDLSKNIHIMHWVPQQSILAHPNCKIFISHGGLLSLSEALHFGVPIIGIPLFADHHVNMMRAVKRGFALKIDLNEDITEQLRVAINEMLFKTQYHEKMKEYSYIYRHRPVKPSAAVVYWVEHVIETKGARYLQSPALNMPLYQKLYLDLLAVVLTLVIVIVHLFKKLSTFFVKVKKIEKTKKTK